jgi:3-deoxy-D-manno-octulosonate 8-phosphate phosphatase (KDO 8-P phosphatase)
MIKKLHKQILPIKLLLTDNDGVLTDAGVYYSQSGEELKRFSIRDGLGVARLREIVQIDTGIITGEKSVSVLRRAEKLKILEIHLGVENKKETLLSILERKNLTLGEIAFIGDDVNDLEVIEMVGLSACPADAIPQVLKKVDYVCINPGGHGAFREFAELIIEVKKKITEN